MSKVANFTFDALEKHLCHLLYVLNNLLIDPKWHCISATNIIKRHDKSIIVMMSTSTTNGCVPARHFSDESWLDCCVTAGISLITVTMSLVDQWRRYVEVCEFFKYGPHRYETFFYRTSAPMRTVIIGMVLSVCLSVTLWYDFNNRRPTIRRFSTNSITTKSFRRCKDVAEIQKVSPQRNNCL